MKYCGKCGTQMDNTAMFCQSCGTPSTTPTYPQAPMCPQTPCYGFTEQPKPQRNGRLQKPGNLKWYYIAILGTLFLQLLIADFFRCVNAAICILEKRQTYSMGHLFDVFGDLRELIALLVYGIFIATAIPLFSKPPLKRWPLFLAAGASGVLLLAFPWMYLRCVSAAREVASATHPLARSGCYPSVFGYLFIAAALATIVLVFLANKAFSKSHQPQMPMQ